MARPLGASPILILLLVLGVPDAGGAAARLELEPVLDTSIIGGSILLRLAIPLVAPEPPVFEAPLEAPPDGLDGIAALRLDEDLAKASDWALWSTIALGLGAVMVDGAREDRIGTNAVIFAESLLVTAVVTDATKRFTQRPRPYTYSAPTGDPFDSASFISGHSSTAAAALFSAARLVDLQNELTGWEQLSIYSGATALALGVGSLRIAGGLHFPTDVFAGVGVGAAIALILPALHQMSPAEDRGTARGPLAVPHREPLILSFGGRF